MRLQDIDVSAHRCGLFLGRDTCAQPCEVQHGRVSESQDVNDVGKISFLKRELTDSCTEYRALLTGLECSSLAGIQEGKENAQGLLTDIEVRGTGRDRASGGAPEYPSERRVPLFEAWKGRCRSSRVA